jgi:iron complex outermembrane recepter protein
LGRGVLPVRNRGRDCGRSSVFRSFLISTSAIAVAAFTAASPGVAQTAAEPATADQKKLPPISVSGQHPVKPGPVKKPRPDVVAHPSPNANGTPAPPSPSQSQPLAGVPMTPLNTVAASASRLGLPVLETPASVDIVTAQTMQEQGYRTTTDTAQGAVGVLAGDAAGAPANFSMRGFTFNEVNVLYNGIWTGPSDITARWMGTANLEQVEFLKGPSSLMTGLNAIGGSVNYVSRQPTTGPVRSEADVSFDSYGSLTSHYGSGGSTPVQGLDYRFDASTSKMNSFIDGDFRDLTDLSGQFNYRVTNNFKTFVAVEYKNDSGHAYWGTPLVPTSFAGSHGISGVVSGTAISEFDSSVIGPVTIDNRTLSTNYNVADNATGAKEVWLRGGFEWTPTNNVTIKNQAYYYKVQANWIDSETYAFDNGLIAAGTIDRDRFAVSHDQKLYGDNTDISIDSWIFGMENRFATQLQASSNKITFKQDDDGGFPQDNVSVISPDPGTYGAISFDTRNSRLDDYATSFEDRLKVTSAFALIGGVRVEDFRLARDGVNADGTIPDGQPFTKTWAPVSYRAAYTYEPIHNLMFYSMYATAFDPAIAGVFSLNPDNGPLSLTSARTYETGAKQILWDGKAQWTVAAYDILQKNVLVPVSTTVDDIAGAVSTKGIEVAGAVRPIEGLKLWGNVALNHSRFDNFDVWTGNTPPDVAPIIVNAGASYRFDHWRWPVEFGGSVRHVGDRYVFQDNLTTMDAYTTADAYTFVDIPGRDLPWRTVDTLRVTFRVRNLTNAVYAQWADPGLADQILLGTPRTYEVAASAKW